MCAICFCAENLKRSHGNLTGDQVTISGTIDRTIAWTSLIVLLLGMTMSAQARNIMTTRVVWPSLSRNIRMNILFLKMYTLFFSQIPGRDRVRKMMSLHNAILSESNCRDLIVKIISLIKLFFAGYFKQVTGYSNFELYTKMYKYIYNCSQ